MAASIYQWVVVYSILFFLYHVFKPYGLEKIGQLIALASLWGLIVMPLYQLGKFFYVPGRLEKVKKARMFASLAAVIAILAAVLFIPLPHTVMAVMEIQPHGADPVYVNATEGGCLAQLQRQGRPDRWSRASGWPCWKTRTWTWRSPSSWPRRTNYEVRLEVLTGPDHSEHESTETMPQLEKDLESVRKQRKEDEADHERLILKAARDGIVLPPPPTPARTRRDGGGPVAVLVRHAAGRGKLPALSQGRRALLPWWAIRGTWKRCSSSTRATSTS